MQTAVDAAASYTTSVAQQDTVLLNESFNSNNHATAYETPVSTYAAQRTTASFHALYTKHKTQKRKIWQDGRLVVRSHGVALHAAHPPPGGGDPVLDVCSLLPAQIQDLKQGRLTDLETEKFLVQVEGPWQGADALSTTGSAPKPTANAGLQKILQRKFRKPAPKRPPPPSTGPPAFLQKRQPPLQPGELQKQYYGTSSVAPSRGAPVPAHPYAVAPPRNPPPPFPHPSIQNQCPQQPQPPQNHPSQNHGSLSESSNSPRYATTQRPMQQPAAFSASTGPPGRQNPSATARPTQRFSAQRSEFASNAFDPRGFYGEDGDDEEEEEDEEEETSRTAWSVAAPASTFQPPTTTHHQQPTDTAGTAHVSKTMYYQRTDSPTAPKTYSVPPQPAVGNTIGGTLTTNDLLELFGDDDAPTEDYVTDRLDANGQSSRVGKNSDEQQQHRQQSTAPENHDILTLPPPSDSSDEEEEDD